MKFLALKQALEKYEKETDVARPVEVSGLGKGQSLPFFGKLGKNNHIPVVGGTILWKPIDRTAAFVISKAPWWAHPPQQSKPVETRDASTNKRNKPTRKNKKSMKDFTGQELVRDGEPRVKTTLVNGQEMFNLHDIAVQVVAEINKSPQELTPLARATFDARTVLDENLVGLGGLMEDFRAKTKAYLDEIRQTRFAVISETASISTGLKDIRQFFHGPTYAEEIKRLTEFVDLCERLQKLQQSGFMEAITDTMLRLSK